MYTTEEYFCRRYTPEGEELFGQRLLQTDWSEIEKDNPTDTAAALEAVLSKMFDECYPIVKGQEKINRCSMDHKGNQKTY